MDLVSYIKLYAMATVVFFALDIVWLGYIARGFYRNNLGSIISPEVNWSAAVVFYLLYIVGILVFAIVPALKAGSIQTAIIWGALFGFFTYATYDLTNMATIKNWPLKIVIVDIVWGSFLCSVVAFLSVQGGKWLNLGFHN
jgi:uncharacterized membrane protein